MATLSEQERAQLRGLGQGQVPGVVEAILTARLAKVEALADDWAGPWNHTLLVGEWETRQECSSRIRAALASDPTHTQDGGA